MKNRIALISDSIRKALASFSLGERVIFTVLALIALLATFSTLHTIDSWFLKEIPKKGGSFVEGVIGTERYVNPLLAFSDTDRDLTSLVYSGLLKAKPDGSFVGDLAEKYSISEDGKTYDFTIKDNAVFHDGTPVTADDVIFTIQKVEDPALKSPKRANWDGVKIEKTGEKTLEFTLKQAYAPFIENLTLGILPKHIWKGATADEFAFSQFNIEPIGSGPYKVGAVKRNASGIPESITLQSFDKYTLGAAYISTIVFNFYQNEKGLTDAYKNGDVESIHSVSGDTALALEKDNSRIEHYPLPQTFAIFFNQSNNPIFAHKEVRIALNSAIDRQALIKEVLYGFGTEATSPIPKGLSESEELSPKSQSVSLDSARSTLEKAGWKKNSQGIYELKSKNKTETLNFSISTGDAPELKKAAEIIKKQWEELGATVDVKVFEMNDLNQTIIRPRKYDALFFGEVIGRELDLYAFWHSSQRNDPGLNIAMYTNAKTDSLLETARTLSDESKRMDKYEAFEKEIINDSPAVFAYSPDFIYILPKNIKGFSLGKMVTPSDRFADIEKWYVETDNVWEIFIPQYLKNKN